MGMIFQGTIVLGTKHNMPGLLCFIVRRVKRRMPRKLSLWHHIDQRDVLSFTTTLLLVNTLLRTVNLGRLRCRSLRQRYLFLRWQRSRPTGPCCQPR